MANNEQNTAASTAAPVTSVASATPTASAAAPALPPNVSMEQLMAMFVASQTQIAQLLEQQGRYNQQALKIAPRRRRTMREYLREKPRKYLKHGVYQNGNPVNPKGLSQETIDLVDTLDSGLYCDGLVQVMRIRDGLEGVNSRIHLRYNNKHEMQRMQIYMKFPTFTSMVQQIAAEMKALGKKPVNEAFPPAPEFEFPDELSDQP